MYLLFPCQLRIALSPFEMKCKISKSVKITFENLHFFSLPFAILTKDIPYISQNEWSIAIIHRLSYIIPWPKPFYLLYPSLASKLCGTTYLPGSIYTFPNVMSVGRWKILSVFQTAALLCLVMGISLLIWKLLIIWYFFIIMLILLSLCSLWILMRFAFNNPFIYKSIQVPKSKQNIFSFPW